MEEGGPRPKTILRGHRVQVHAAAFCRGNERLLTGDADGFVVAWDLTIMRPRAVWQAHTNALLGIAPWGRDRVITHGRDHRLVVWRLGPDQEVAMSTSLPLTPQAEPRPQPWILHMLEVNTMNFCTFSSCVPPGGEDGELLVAVPNTLASEAIDIFHLPSQNRMSTAKPGDKHGMVMALALFPRAGTLTLIAAFEDGLTTVASLDQEDDAWVVTYRTTCHVQPALSLDVDPTRSFFLTSGADDVIAKHPIPAVPKPRTRPEVCTEPLKMVHTRHSGQQGLRIRSDAKVFATAGWDSKVRVYSAKTMKEVAVLKWHQVGCYTAAFADVGGEGTSSEVTSSDPDQGQTKAGEQGETEVVVPRLVEMTLKGRRVVEARTAHWLAAGSKDGKISLWDVF